MQTCLVNESIKEWQTAHLPLDNYEEHQAQCPQMVLMYTINHFDDASSFGSSMAMARYPKLFSINTQINKSRHMSMDT